MNRSEQKSNHSEQISFEEILSTLRKWKKHIIVFCVITSSVVFLAQALPKRGKKIYKATAVVRVSQESSLPLALSNLNLGVRPLEINLKFEADSVKSERNLNEALKILRWKDSDYKKLSDMIEVSYSDRDRTIYINAYSSDPVESKYIADAVAQAYVSISRKRFEEMIDRSMEYLRESAEDVSGRLRVLYDNLADLVEDTGVVEPRVQIESKVREIEKIREQLYKVESEISYIESFLLDISKDKGLTREKVRDRNKIFEKDGVPMGKEAVGILKERIGDMMAIDEDLSQAYFKYMELEERRGELIKQLSEEHPRVREIDREISRALDGVMNGIKILLARLKLERERLREGLELARGEIKEVSRYISDYLYIGNNIEMMNSFFENYYANYIQMKIATGLWTSYAEVYRYAEVPGMPVRRIWRELVISLMVSLIGGVIFGFLLEGMDTRFKDGDQIKIETGLNIGGVMGWDKVEIGGDIGLRFYEDLRRLKLSLQLGRKFFSVAVVGATSGEGKTTLVWGLSKVLSDYGYRVGILDLNLRHPEISESFGVDEGRCISNVLMGTKGMEDIEIRIGERIGLYGVYSGNMLWGSDVLMSDSLVSFLLGLRSRYDYVIVDTSPVMVVPDSVAFLRNFDVVLAVYDISRTDRRLYKKMVSVLREIGLKDIRCVVNKVKEEHSESFHYISNLKKYRKYYQKYYRTKVVS